MFYYCVTVSAEYTFIELCKYNTEYHRTHHRFRRANFVFALFLIGHRDQRQPPTTTWGQRLRIFLGRLYVCRFNKLHLTSHNWHWRAVQATNQTWAHDHWMINRAGKDFFLLISDLNLWDLTFNRSINWDEFNLFLGYELIRCGTQVPAK